MIDIIGYTNTGQIQLSANWLASLARLGNLERVTLYCTTADAHFILNKLCSARGWPVNVRYFTVSQFMGGAVDIAKQTDWGTPEFARLVVGRLQLMLELCQEIPFRPFLQADMDCAFVRDPEPLLEQCLGPDPWIQSNRNDSERPRLEHKEFCNGVTYYPSPQPEVFRRAIAWLVQRWPTIEANETGKYVDDEDALNAVMCELGIEPGALPIEQFPTGRNPWDRNPIIVHANWVIGLQAKIGKLRTGGHRYLCTRSLLWSFSLPPACWAGS